MKQLKIKINNKIYGIALALVVMALWGSLFPFIKLGYKSFEIDTSFIPNLILFAGIRFFVCGVGITGYSAAKKELKRFTLREFLSIIAVSFFAIILHYVCTYAGLAMADSSSTALLKQLGAFLFIPFSFLFFKEDKFSVKKLIALLLGIAGIAVLNITSDGFSLGFGEILVIIASFSSIISGIISKTALNTVGAYSLTGISQLFGGVFLTLLGFSLGGRITSISFGAIMIFVYICASSTVAYCLWNLLLKRANLSYLLILKFAEPIFAAVFSAILLAENIFTLRFLFALILTSVGIVISNLRRA